MIALHTGKFIKKFEIAKKTWNQTVPSILRYLLFLEEISLFR